MLLIRPDCYDAMLEHAAREQPNECCGLLAGRPGIVEVVRPVGNAAEDPSVTYELRSQDLFDGLRWFETTGLHLVGVYHSHPVSDAWPSSTDIRRTYLTTPEETSYPGISWLIISLAHASPVLRSFRIERASVTEEDWRIA